MPLCRSIVPEAQPEISQTRSVWLPSIMNFRPDGTMEVQRRRMPRSHSSVKFHWPSYAMVGLKSSNTTSVRQLLYVLMWD